MGINAREEKDYYEKKIIEIAKRHLDGLCWLALLITHTMVVFLIFGMAHRDRLSEMVTYL